MVQLLMLAIYRHGAAPIRLAQTQNLSDFNFFTRHAILEHLHFACRLVCQRTEPGSRQTIDVPDMNAGDGIPYVCHIHVRFDQLCGIMIADQDYPQRAAFQCINRFLQEYTDSVGEEWKEETKDVAARSGTSEPAFLKAVMRQWQNPREADNLLRAQSSLDDVTQIMRKNMQQILARGQTLEDLMRQSDDLSDVSRQFYKQAKKTNQCCKMY